MLKVAGIILTEASLSIGLNFYNSFLLRNVLKFPVIIGDLVEDGPSSAQGVLIVFFGAATVSFAQMRESLLRIALLALLRVASITTNNWSLEYIDLTLNKVIKASAPVFTVALSVLWERKVYSARKIAALGVLALGTMLSCLSRDASTPPIHWVLALVSAAVGGSSLVVSAMLLGRGSGAPLRPLDATGPAPPHPRVAATTPPSSSSARATSTSRCSSTSRRSRRRCSARSSRSPSSPSSSSGRRSVATSRTAGDWATRRRAALVRLQHHGLHPREEHVVGHRRDARQPQDRHRHRLRRRADGRRRRARQHRRLLLLGARQRRARRGRRRSRSTSAASSTTSPRLHADARKMRKVRLLQSRAARRRSTKAVGEGIARRRPPSEPSAHPRTLTTIPQRFSAPSAV